MECDLDIFESKIKEVSRAILTKECTLEDVLTDIKECGFGLKQAWNALEKACQNFKCSKLKGRIGLTRGPNDQQCYVELMILNDIANLVLDVMSTALSKASDESLSNFFTPKAPKVEHKEGQKQHEDADMAEEVVLIESKKVEDVFLYIDPMTANKIHLLLPKEDSEFVGQEVNISLGPLSLDLRQKCWSLDLTFSKAPKGFSIPSETRCVLVRFLEK